MRDFSLYAYECYISEIKKYLNCLTFSEFIPNQEKLSNFALIRHDVDRHPNRALKMAILEHKHDVKSTYYFRTKKHTFVPQIITHIQSLGHEIGFHYESLSDSKGDIPRALKMFKEDLKRLRQYASVKTISMHGRPSLNTDNRDLWRDPERHKMLKQDLDIIGEVYLDINYENIAYINDTGRNWTRSHSNRRDTVASKVNASFENSKDLSEALKTNRFNKIVFQIHPERWTNDRSAWIIQAVQDYSINFIKKIVR